MNSLYVYPHDCAVNLNENLRRKHYWDREEVILAGIFSGAWGCNFPLLSYGAGGDDGFFMSFLWVRACASLGEGDLFVLALVGSRGRLLWSGNLLATSGYFLFLFGFDKSFFFLRFDFLA